MKPINPTIDAQNLKRPEEHEPDMEEHPITIEDFEQYWLDLLREYEVLAADLTPSAARRETGR